MRVLLTGATGLLGHNVLARLVAEGCEVVCAVRHTGRIAVPQNPLWHEVVADPTRVVQITAVAKGCDAIVNCAGMTDMAAMHHSDYKAANIDICRTLCEAAKRMHIPIVVHVSSTNTIGYGSSHNPTTEAAPMAEPFASSMYAQSKAEGEQVMTRFAEQNAWCRVVVLNIGYLIGPYDTKPSSGKILALAYRKPIAFAPKGGKAFVSTTDVAHAVWQSLANTQASGRYLITNQQAELTFAELYRLQATTMHYRQVVCSLPNWVLTVAGRCGDLLRKLGVRTMLSTNNVRQLMVEEHYNNQRARVHLGLQENPLEQAIAQFHEWNNTHKPTP